MQTLFGFDDLASDHPRNQHGPRPAPIGREAAIDRILAGNPSASAAFLGQFSTGQLRLYAEHLTVAAGPRGPDARWIRPGETPAITASRSAA
ncbi:MAG: hypothetical protein AAGB48_12225 [Planctomycetota bacterium]